MEPFKAIVKQSTVYVCTYVPMLIIVLIIYLSWSFQGRLIERFTNILFYLLC